MVALCVPAPLKCVPCAAGSCSRCSRPRPQDLMESQTVADCEAVWQLLESRKQVLTVRPSPRVAASMHGAAPLVTKGWC